jgi:hypothetical protein
MADNGHKSDWVSLQGEITAAKIRALGNKGHIDKLSLSKGNLITAAIARGFKYLESVEWMWLWCSVTRTAMREVLTVPNLKTLHVLEIRHPGQLQNTELAESLIAFRANHYMSEMDLFAVSKFPALEELGAQNSAISESSLAAILEMQYLQNIDLEGTGFDDKMAKTVSHVDRIKKLDLGATRLTGKGLKHLCDMKQLISLDLWANDIAVEDLDMLVDLPHLEYLSVGGYSGQDKFTSKGVLPRLKKIGSLKRIWLDGISVSEEEQKDLEERYEYVRL